MPYCLLFAQFKAFLVPSLSGCLLTEGMFVDYPHTRHITALNGWCVYHYFLISAVGSADWQNFPNFGY